VSSWAAAHAPSGWREFLKGAWEGTEIHLRTGAPAFGILAQPAVDSPAKSHSIPYFSSYCIQEMEAIPFGRL